MITNATPSLAINGIAAGGGPGSAQGPRVYISDCTDGGATCSFTTSDFALNDLRKVGPFHAGDDLLQLVLNAADKALDGDGGPAGNTAWSIPVAFKATRYWWSQQLTTPISGLAIHPGSGGASEIIATTRATNGNSVFALRRTGPLNAAGAQHWAQGAGWYSGPPASDLGSVDGAPAIGATGNIYVATTSSDLVAMDPTGGLVWQCGKALAAFHNTPAVGTVAKLGNSTNCEAVIAAADDYELWGACPSSGTSGTYRAAGITDVGTSPAIISSGAIYVGANGQLAKTTLSATTGSFTTASLFPATPALNAWTNLASDGTQLYATTPMGNSSRVYEFESNLHATWDNAAVAKTIIGQPVIVPASMGGTMAASLVLNTSDRNLRFLSTATGVEGSPKPLLNAGSTPLVGSDSRIYTAAGNAFVAVNAADRSIDWQFSPAGASTFTAAPNMDCNGVLYAAAGYAVYAFITDAQGLANTPWPKYQRDSRNSGNADAVTQWGVRTAPGPAGCLQ